jgi:tetratricopeptide (TPR) repeat protein
MKKTTFIFLFLLISISSVSLKNLPGIEPKTKSLKTIYNKLNPKSALEHFAFYELYPETYEGKQSLKKAWKLLKQDTDTSITMPNIDINMMISLVNNQSVSNTEIIDEKTLSFLESLGKTLKNRKLKGYNQLDPNIIKDLPVNEIDLSRALLVEDLGNDKESIYKIRYYEVCLDLMALQILSKLKDNYKPIDLVHAINDFIFYDMRFRFPPQSYQNTKIDVYTLLSSVMDSRRGVCLGVSILYLSLAQRLGLDLEIITPPGHIYVRYKDENNKITNIETTARGVNYPSEVYLSIETKKLQQRNIKEVVGLAFMNQASVYWGNNKYDETIKLYEKAMRYLEDDLLIKYFLGLNYLFVNKVEEGKKLLKLTKELHSEFSTTNDTLAIDFLDKKADIEAIKTVFLNTDATKESIIKKQESLKKVIEKFPKFRSAIMQLASSYLQLGREKEALIYLNKFYEIDQTDPSVNYYLSVLFYERYDYKNSWKYLQNTKKILEKHNHDPKALKELEDALKIKYPKLSL